MKLAGVIGYPIAHSLSPVLHRYWIDALGLDAAYIPIPADAAFFSQVLASVRQAGFAGVNVTLPHKRAAFAISGAPDATALATGAANLLLFQGDAVVARNTDVFGLRTSLAQDIGTGLISGQQIALLGSGGAARAAVLALAEFGAKEIRIFSRTPARAFSLINRLQPEILSAMVLRRWSDWSRVELSDITLLVNATSGGMKGASPLEVDLECLPKSAAVYDLVYNPLETELLKTARARGHTVTNGLGMLIWQAVPAFEAFFGVEPAVTADLRARLERAIRA